MQPIILDISRNILYDNYAIYNIQYNENLYFVRILNFKVSQEKRYFFFLFIICVSLYAFCCMYSEYALHILENKSIIKYNCC